MELPLIYYAVGALVVALGAIVAWLVLVELGHRDHLARVMDGWREATEDPLPVEELKPVRVVPPFLAELWLIGEEVDLEVFRD